MVSTSGLTSLLVCAVTLLCVTLTCWGRVLTSGADSGEVNAFREIVDRIQARRDKQTHGLEKRGGPRQVTFGVSPSHQCQRFSYRPNQVTYLGEELQRVGDGYTPEECQEACLGSPAFTCMAVQMQKPAACFIAGYRVRDNFHSTYYMRNCEHGPQCFVPFEGQSAAISGTVAIPRYFTVSREISALYCMARCEQMSTCVGFDLRTDENRLRCVFQDMGLLEDRSFDLYLRRC